MDNKFNQLLNNLIDKVDRSYKDVVNEFDNGNIINLLTSIKRLNTYTSLITKNVEAAEKVNEFNENIEFFINKFNTLDKIQSNMIRLNNMTADAEVKELIAYLNQLEAKEIKRLASEVTDHDLETILERLKDYSHKIDYTNNIKDAIETVVAKKIDTTEALIKDNYVKNEDVNALQQNLEDIRYNLEIYINLIDDDSHINNLKSVIKNYKFIQLEVEFLEDLLSLKTLLEDEDVDEKLIKNIKDNIKSQKLNVEMIIHDKLKSLFQITKAVY